MGSPDIWERGRRTLALATALQSYAQWSGGPNHIMCGAARDLQECMTNLMQHREEDILDAMLLEPVDDQQLTSQTQKEETMLLSEPQEAEAAATHPLRCEEWAPEPEKAAKQKEAVTEPQGALVHLPLPGFESLPPEQDILLIRIPNLEEVQSVLMPVGTMSMVVYKNKVIGNLEYEYETHYLKPLCLDSPNHRPKVTEL